MRPKKLDKLLLNLETQPSKALDRRITALITQAAKQGSGKVSPELALWRYIMQSKITKIAAAIAIVLVSIVAFHSFDRTTSVTWAGIINPLLTAQTVVFDVVADSQGVTANMKVLNMGTQRTRYEIEPPQGPPIIIFDQERSQMLQLMPGKKLACLIDFANLPDEYSENYLASLRNLIKELQNDPNVSIEELPGSVIEDRDAVGFRAESTDDSMTIWADPETLLPIRVELNQNQTGIHAVFTNFQFDSALDPALFSMDIPEGYSTVTGQGDLGESSENALLEGLRIWAQVLEDNQFPVDISVAAYTERIPEIMKRLKDGTIKLSAQQKLDMSLKIQKCLQFVMSLKAEQDWHYVGAFVPFGDADKPVCWYKPNGSETYRVIYGDLSVRDLLEEDLPK